MFDFFCVKNSLSGNEPVEDGDVSLFSRKIKDGALVYL